MAFEGISEKLQKIFKKLTGRGKLSESDVKESMREIKLALLEADVNFRIVKDFISKVSERAVGSEVLDCLTPGQQVVKIVQEELTSLMGSSVSKIEFGSVKPSVILVCGLQGAGKTTFCGKLSKHLSTAYGKKCLLVACDIYRPAAIEQLRLVGAASETPVFEKGQSDPVQTAAESVSKAKHDFIDVVIIDTAGRLHIDKDMMDELVKISEHVHPAETLLVVDAMTGQDAVNVAKTFDETLPLTGIVLSKLDGDTRAGAALSVKAVTGKPVKFVSAGEKISDIELFYPDRMASRILGMGDILSLIEKAEKNFNQEKAVQLTKKIRNDEFTLEDFMDQMDQMKNMGSLSDILKMIPGASNLQNMAIDEKALSHTKAIIQSMTVKERQNPDILNASRRRRIARGCGMEVQDVNRLINQFTSMKKMMKQFGNKKFKGKFRGFPVGF